MDSETAVDLGDGFTLLLVHIIIADLYRTVHSRSEVETEEHMRIMADRQLGRTRFDLLPTVEKQINKTQEQVGSQSGPDMRSEIAC